MQRERELLYIQTHSTVADLGLIWSWNMTNMTPGWFMLLIGVQLGARNILFYRLWAICDATLLCTNETDMKGNCERILFTHQQLLLTKQRWGEELKIEVKPVINGTDITMVVLSWAIWPVPVSDARHSPEENNKLNLSLKGFQSGLSHMWLSPSVHPGKK